MNRIKIRVGHEIEDWKKVRKANVAQSKALQRAAKAVRK